METSREIPLKSWHLYFPKEEYTEYNDIVTEIIMVHNKIKLSPAQIDDIRASRSYECGYSFYQTLGHSPDIHAISCAVSERVYEQAGELLRLETRIVGVPLQTSFSAISSDRVGQLVSLYATVSSISFRRIENTILHFECAKCSKILQERLQDNIYRTPVCSCKGRTMFLLQSHPGNRCIDRQDIRIQEVCAYDRTAATAEVALEGMLVGTVAPGDLVEITGIITTQLIQDAYRLKVLCNNIRKLQSKAIYSVIPRELKGLGNAVDENISTSSNNTLSANSNHTSPTNSNNTSPTNSNHTSPTKSNNTSPTNSNHTSPTKSNNTSIITSGNPSAILLSEEFVHVSDEFMLFKRISELHELMALCTELFFPRIVGHKAIKEGLVLSLFGGCSKKTDYSAIRSEIHAMIIGDPGLGKSRLLLAAASILPKSTVVNGSSCTPAGLTVSIAHDPATGEYMADAGAMVLCDGGLCCIDEFDKLDDFHTLFEAMESQTITVAKGGVVCSVPARATIIAASNPKQGSFDERKSIQSNLRFPAALLARFDMVFIVKDNGESMDEPCISKEIMNVLVRDNVKAPDTKYSMDTMRRYIDYARNTVHPILTRSAKDVIMRHYSLLRRTRRVSVRNLESLIRLCEGFARMRLRSIASSADAESAIELYSNCFLVEGSEEDKPSKRAINDCLKEYVAISGPFISKGSLIEIIREAYAGSKEPETILEMLNCQGIVLLCGNGNYKISIR